MGGSIDRMFAYATDVVDALDQILPSAEADVHGEVQHHAPPPQPQASPRDARDARRTSAYEARAAASRRELPAPPAAPAALAPPSTSTAIAARPKFRIVSAVDDAGNSVWVVTDGQDYAACSSEDFARRVRAGLG